MIKRAEKPAIQPVRLRASNMRRSQPTCMYPSTPAYHCTPHTTLHEHRNRPGDIIARECLRLACSLAQSSLTQNISSRHDPKYQPDRVTTATEHQNERTLLKTSSLHACSLAHSSHTQNICVV
jgi:hypothetical protein